MASLLAFPCSTIPKFLSSSSFKTLIPLRPSISHLRPWKRIPIAASGGFVITETTLSDYDSDSDSDSDIHFDLEIDMSSPWEGAVVYRRDGSVTHVEYATTLERLGLEKLSSNVSVTRASEMGLRVACQRGSPLDPSPSGGTPVLVSFGVTHKKGRLILDGIVRTVISLHCYQCTDLTPVPVFKDLTLLLSEEPIQKPKHFVRETFYNEDMSKSSFSREKEDDVEKSIEWDNRLHFPAGQKEMDISKQIRDLVHLQITINVECKPGCKGICFNCGKDLNLSNCICKPEEQESGLGPFKNLKKQLQQS